MFKISDKVVRVKPRVNDALGEYDILGSPMEVGRVYVVCGVDPAYEYHEGPMCGVYLVGCEAYYKAGGYVAPWVASRFRKLEDIKEENRKKQQEPQPV